MRKSALLFLLIPLYFSCLRAQSPVSRRIDFSAGLPSNTVYNLMQDSKGYIWISHEKGLSRYNGQTLRHYSNNMLQSRGLSNLAEDKYGRVWCQNFSGEIFYASENTLVLCSKLQSLGNYTPFGIYQGSKIITSRAPNLVSYDIDSRELLNISAAGDQVISANILTDGDLIYSVVNHGRSIACYKSNNKLWTLELSADVYPYIFVKYGKKVLVLPRMGNQKYFVIDNGRISKIGSFGLSTIIQDAAYLQDALWVSTTEGAYRFNSRLEIMNSGKPFFSDCNVSKILLDSENSMWVSTLNKGVLIIPNMEVKLLEGEISGLTTCSYFNTVNRLIVGTGDNRIYELNPGTLSVNLLKDLGIKNEVIRLYNDVSNDRIWVSSDKLYALKGATNTIDLALTVAMKDIVYLDRGCYAMASPEGISIIRLDNDTTDQYFAKAFTGKPIPWISNRQLLPGSEGRAKTVAYDAVSGILYGSNYKGLFSWSLNGKRTTYTYKGAQIFASHIQVKGTTAYVGTYGGKMFVIEKGKIVRVVESFKGLQGKSITRACSDGDHVWLLFENNLVRYNIYTQKYNTITHSDGLPMSEIKDIAAGSGYVFLATRSGLVYFKSDLKKRLSSPRLLIEQVTANHKSIEKKNGAYNLRTNENNLEISLSVISYRNNASIKILYSINNKSWMELGGTDRVLNLVGLAPGNYTVRFKALTLDGREIPAIENLAFNIAAPMYTRWWFILLVLLLISALVYFFMRFRIYELKKEAEFRSAREKLERELQISTLASIKSQMNPHFVFNALNTVQSYIFTNEKENATDYLNKFSELTRMILDMSNKEKVSLSEEIKALTLYLDLEKKRFEDTIEYQIILSEDISSEMIQIPSMLIQPYVENAIKHGLLHKKGARKLKIEILKEDAAIIVFIDDNGIGRKKSQEMKALKPSSHKSFASEANKKRLQLLNQGRENTIDIEYLDKLDSYGNSLGTMVILAIPLNF